MATNVSNAALFGDSDSSDEDEVMKDAPSAAQATQEPHEKQQEATNENPETQEDDDDATPKETDPSNKPPPNSSALFGDDSSDEDDEFVDDSIVGKSAADGAAVAKGGGGDQGEKKVQTMSERLGLQDSDDEEETKKTEETEPIKPIHIPPRKMELLNLQPTASSPDEDNNTSATQPLLHIVKLPNLVGINSTPYNPNTHNLEEEEEYYRGYVHNMVRWRYKSNNDGEILRHDDGTPIRESNTRLVKWSDGSYTLHVGSEVLEVDNLDSSVPVDAEKAGTARGLLPGFAGINGYLYVSQKARIRVAKNKDGEGGETKQEDADEESEEETQPTGTVLECIGPILSRFAPRPSSLASEAHRNLTNAIRQRNVKRARIAEIVTDFDPEKEKAARIKGKDDLAKSLSRGGRRSGGGGGRRKLNSDYLEEEDGYDGVNVGRLKKQTMRRDYSEDEMDDYGEDSESEEDEWSKNKKRKRPTAAAAGKSKKDLDEDSDSSEEGEVVFGDDDDEDDGAMFKKKGAAKSNVLDDDDD